ncbi:fungal-specific transcription factor domain-containing protein [Echria macrotheca]|uniref:Fungal-specific transcription factor domain-containing protein n=1 Tax=Echria macrotheca TaxID=438768 RepID=A0AAJ0F8I8_9PEZI|nr:fungal-specific transcription factor domain-containing protein [Echria macrotheca]
MNQPIGPGGRSLLPCDQPFDHSTPFRLPPRIRQDSLLDEFFNGWFGTFHFVHRPSVLEWLDWVDSNWSAGIDLWRGIGHARAAIVLMALAIGSFYRSRHNRDLKRNKPEEWVWSLNFGDNMFKAAVTLVDAEAGDPTLESAQARLLQDIYLLCTSRTKQAWYTFGNTLQILTALDLHRRLGRNRGLGLDVKQRPNYAKIQCERRIFWSAYIIDKQLSIILGRPGHFSADNIDQEYPDCVNDEDADIHGPIRAPPSDCYVAALVSQAHLNKLFERIYREVYSLRDIPVNDRLKAAHLLGVEVEEWKENLPSLLNSQRATILLPIFRRQAGLLRLAYCHAQILVYRPFLMSPYPAEKGRRRPVDTAVRRLGDAARLAVGLVHELARNNDQRMFSTFWYPHQIGYCGAAVLYLLPHVRERQKLFWGPNFRGMDKTDLKSISLADNFTKLLAESTNPYSSGPRCAIILRELKAEAERQFASDPNEESSSREISQSREQSESPEPSDEEPEVTQQARQTQPAAEGVDEDDDDSPNEQLLVDALRAHWEADISDQPPNPNPNAAPARTSLPGHAATQTAEHQRSAPNQPQPAPQPAPPGPSPVQTQPLPHGPPPGHPPPLGHQPPSGHHASPGHPHAPHPGHVPYAPYPGHIPQPAPMSVPTPLPIPVQPPARSGPAKLAPRPPPPPAPEPQPYPPAGPPGFHPGHPPGPPAHPHAHGYPPPPIPGYLPYPPNYGPGYAPPQGHTQVYPPGYLPHPQSHPTGQGRTPYGPPPPGYAPPPPAIPGVSEPVVPLSPSPVPEPRWRLWDEWKITDWLDLDAAAYGPISDYAHRGAGDWPPP